MFPAACSWKETWVFVEDVSDSRGKARVSKFEHLGAGACLSGLWEWITALDRWLAAGNTSEWSINDLTTPPLQKNDMTHFWSFQLLKCLAYVLFVDNFYNLYSRPFECTNKHLENGPSVALTALRLKFGILLHVAKVTTASVTLPVPLSVKVNYALSVPGCRIWSQCSMTWASSYTPLTSLTLLSLMGNGQFFSPTLMNTNIGR